MFKLSNKGIDFVKEQMKRYETKRSAIIPCLFLVQKENKGWVSSESMEYLGQLMDVPVAWIEEVASFYTLFNKKPVGRCHVQVCCNVSCYMRGADELVESLCSHFKVKPGEMSEKSEMTVSRVECLGACDEAPMVQIEDQYHYKLTPESLLDLVKKKIYDERK